MSEQIRQLQDELEQLRAQRKRVAPEAALETLIQRMYDDVAQVRELMVPEIRFDVPTPEVRVDVPDQSVAFREVADKLEGLVAQLAAVAAAVASKEPTVVVEPVPLNLTVEQSGMERTVVFQRDQQGRITGATVRDA